jgi:hypothetical protein
MPKKRKVSLNSNHRQHFPEASLDELPRSERRRLQRDNLLVAAKYPSLMRVQMASCGFERSSFVTAAARYALSLEFSDDRVLNSFVADLVWSRLAGEDTSLQVNINTTQIKKLVQQQFEATNLGLLGRQDFGLVALAAVATDQVAIQRQPAKDLYRSVEIFSGLDLGLPADVSWWGIILFALRLRLNKPTGEQELHSYFAPFGEARVKSAIETVKLLALDVSAQLPQPTGESLNPLLKRPIIRLSDGTFVCPVPDFLTNAVSPVGLYIRGMQQPQKGREFSESVGESVARYVAKRLSQLVERGWVVIDVDKCVAPGAIVGKHADFVLLSPSGSLAVVLEIKATMQTRNARLGIATDLEKCTKNYEKAFGQIDHTVAQFGSASPINLAQVPTKVETFGLVVTMEKHFITRCNEEIFPGLAIGKPSWTGVTPKIPATVICLDELDSLVDCLLQIEEPQVREILAASTSGPDPGRNMYQVLSESFPTVESSANEAGLNIIKGFEDRVR